jgi:hypothetical protein
MQLILTLRKMIGISTEPKPRVFNLDLKNHFLQMFTYFG